MKAIEPRDVLVTIIFGVPSAWIYAYLMGSWTTHTTIPLLDTLLEEFDIEHLRTWATTYTFVSQLLGSAICALLITLPLGYLLRGRYIPMAILFSLLFLGGITTSVLIHNYADAVSLLIFLFSSSLTWLLLAWSSAFIFIGRSLRKRKHAV